MNEPFEHKILSELNQVRLNPRKYSGKLSSLLKFYKGKTLERPNKPIIETREGLENVESCIKYLKTIRASPALQWSFTLSKIAKAHVDDIGPLGLQTHVSSEGAEFEERLSKFCVYSGQIGENIDYGNDEPEDIVANFVIDDGVLARKHRLNIMKKDHKFVGAALGPHSVFQIMCVMIFAEYVEENKDDEPLIEENKVKENSVDNEIQEKIIVKEEEKKLDQEKFEKKQGDEKKIGKNEQKRERNEVKQAEEIEESLRIEKNQEFEFKGDFDFNMDSKDDILDFKEDLNSLLKDNFEQIFEDSQEFVKQGSENPKTVTGYSLSAEISKPQSKAISSNADPENFKFDLSELSLKENFEIQSGDNPLNSVSLDSSKINQRPREIIEEDLLEDQVSDLSAFQGLAENSVKIVAQTDPSKLNSIFPDTTSIVSLSVSKSEMKSLAKPSVPKSMPKSKPPMNPKTKEKKDEFVVSNFERSELSKDAIFEIKELFDIYDTSGSGFLDSNALKNMKEGQVSQNSNSEIIKVLGDADIEELGVLNFDNFLDLVVEKLGLSQSNKLKSLSVSKHENVPNATISHTKTTKPKFDPTLFSRPELKIEDIVEIKEAFDMFDIDNTGTINPIDLRNTLRNQGYESKNYTVYRMISNIEADGSEKLNFGEFLDLVSNTGFDTNADEIRKLFNLFDVEKTGFIDIKNLKKVAREIGESLDEQEIIEMIQKSDLDGDGRVSFQDFYEIMNKNIF